MGRTMAPFDSIQYKIEQVIFQDASVVLALELYPQLSNNFDKYEYRKNINLFYKI